MNIFSQKAVAITIILLSPLASFACDNMSRSILDQEKIEIFDLNDTVTPVILYNYRTQQCEPLSKDASDLDMAAHLPSDETTLGMFQVFRNKGESRLNALKHTLEFNINEGQS